MRLGDDVEGAPSSVEAANPVAFEEESADPVSKKPFHTHLHFLGIKFTFRFILFLAGAFLLHLGLLLGYSTTAMVFGFPGWGLILAFIVLFCQDDHEAWQNGHGNGSFFFGVGVAVAVLSTKRVMEFCPAIGDGDAATVVAATGAAIENGTSAGNASTDNSTTYSALFDRSWTPRKREFSAEEADCTLGVVLGFISLLLMGASAVLILLERVRTMHQKAAQEKFEAKAQARSEGKEGMTKSQDPWS